MSRDRSLVSYGLSHLKALEFRCGLSHVVGTIRIPYGVGSVQRN